MGEARATAAAAERTKGGTAASEAPNSVSVKSTPAPFSFFVDDV